MKKLFVFVFLGALSSGVCATELSTTCPSGYIAVIEDTFIIADDNNSCPAGYVVSGITTSCPALSPGAGTCFLYAEKNIDYTDTTGTFQFSDICPLS